MSEAFLALIVSLVLFAMLVIALWIALEAVKKFIERRWMR